MHQLEKTLVVLKPEYDQLVMDVFNGRPILERTLHDVADLDFKMKYLFAHQQDRIESDFPIIMSELEHANTDMKKTWYKFTHELVTRICEMNGLNPNNIFDVYMKNIDMSPRSMDLTLGVLSDDKEFLEKLDELIPEGDNPYTFYEKRFFRYSSESYNEAIEKLYPERFEEKNGIDLNDADNEIFVHNFSFQTSEDCNLNCFAAGTKILMADFTQENIEHISVGDKVLGFAEDAKPGDVNSLKPAEVTRLFKRNEKCYKIMHNAFDKPLWVTGDHPMLTANGEWKKVYELNTKTDGLMFLNLVHHNLEGVYPLRQYDKNQLKFMELYNYTIREAEEAMTVYNMETTTHTYIAGDIQTHNCTYCYQHEKSPGRMSFEIGKQFIDQLLADEYGYINSKNSPAIILEFIGGEPLLEIELTRRLYEYFLDQTYKMNHPWFKFHRISLCSNGLLYFDEKVQAFFREYAHKISFNISIDGNKQLHDSCRIQPNGEGSYDVDMAALNHFNKNYASERNSKMTLASENISYLYDSVVNFINNGMYVINLNCVFEDVWTPETATIEYNQLKKLADYLIENNMENLYVAIFSDTEDGRWGKEFDGNFCGGLGSMLSMDYKGDFYPCLRYMPSSIGDERVKIGNAITGMEGRKEGSKILKQFDDITRRTQSNDICYDCPIGSGCAWCSALCFETYATANKRITFHCIQVIAEALANVYYWNNLILAHPEYELKVRRNNVPDSWALKVIDQEELNNLKELENVAMYRTIEYQKEKNAK